MSTTKKTQNNESYGRFDFVGKVWILGGASLVLTIIALVYLAINGINYGIDFKGGTEMQVKFDGTVTIAQVRETLEDVAKSKNMGEVSVQSVGENSEYVIRFQGAKGSTDKETNELLNEAIASLKGAISAKFEANNPDYRRVDTVGPQVGAELKRNGLLAMFYSLLVILIYVSLRFDYGFAPGAVVCLFHDAVMALAIYVFVGKEVNVAIMAAILTLMGFSLNDTIVVFDRIRENMEKYKDKTMEFIINKSINDMIIRTFITAGAIFFVAVCLYFIAGGVVSDIAFALGIGIVFGVYSSIYVAAPLILMFDKIRGKSTHTQIVHS